MSSSSTSRAIEIEMDTYAGTITIVDDEALILNYLSQALTLRGASVMAFQNGDEALAFFLSLQAGSANPKIMVVDDKLVGSEITGLGIIGKIREVDNDSVLILISGSDIADEVRLAAGLRVDAFLQKPFTGEVLMEAIKNALTRRSQSIVGEAVKSVTGDHAKDLYFKAIVVFVLAALAVWSISNRISDARWQGQQEATQAQILRQLEDEKGWSLDLQAYIFNLTNHLSEKGFKVDPLPERKKHKE